MGGELGHNYVDYVQFGSNWDNAFNSFSSEVKESILMGYPFFERAAKSVIEKGRRANGHLIPYLGPNSAAYLLDGCLFRIHWDKTKDWSFRLDRIVVGGNSLEEITNACKKVGLSFAVPVPESEEVKYDAPETVSKKEPVSREPVLV